MVSKSQDANFDQAINDYEKGMVSGDTLMTIRYVNNSAQVKFTFRGNPVKISSILSSESSIMQHAPNSKETVDVLDAMVLAAAMAVLKRRTDLDIDELAKDVKDIRSEG